MCVYTHIYTYFDCVLIVMLYMFICTEFIEETVRLQRLIFGMLGYFAWLGQVRVLEKIYTFDEVMK